MQKISSEASRSRKCSAKIARKNYKISGIAARRAPKNCANSVSMRSRNRRTLLQFLTEFQVRSNEKTRASGVDVTQIFAPNSREEFNCRISRKSGATHAQQLRAFSQRALHMLKNVAEVDRVDNAFQSEKARVRRRDRANVAPKSRERNAKISKKNSARCAHKKLRALGLRVLRLA